MKLDLNTHRMMLLRVLSLMVGVTVLGVGYYGFVADIYSDHTSLYIRFAIDMITGCSALLAFFLTFGHMRAAAWVFPGALLIYLGRFYIMTSVVDLPSALLPLMIMIIAAYVAGRPALWLFMGAIEVIVMISATLEVAGASESLHNNPVFVIAFLRQVFQIALVAVLVDRTIIVLISALAISDEQRRKADALSMRLNEQAELTVGLQRQINRNAQSEAAACLATAVSHDLGNLLNVIATYVEKAWGDVRQAEGGLADSLNGIEAAADRAVHLNQRITSLARAIPRAPNVVNLSAAVSDIVPLLAMTLGSEIELRVDIGPSDHWVSFDEQCLALILLNLTSNARDALNGHGTVNIVCRRLEDSSVLAFYDNGAGIPENQRRYVFDPFWTTKGPTCGTGLGLFSARQMAEALGGRLVLAPSLGSGAHFELILARAA